MPRVHRVGLTAELSVELLARAQTPNGAFPASPAHDVYRYAWVRDGSWCAHAMDRAGRRASAVAWHRWMAATVLRHEDRIAEALEAVRRARVGAREMLPARFTLDGEEEAPGEEEWPNFQLDCWGFWLWALADHARRGGKLDARTEAAARLVIGYLLGTAEVPCYDCWEEHPGHRHTSTLAAIVAGLRDAGALLDDTDAQARADELHERLLGPEHTLAGALVRFPGDTRVDGSLLWLVTPLALLAPEDPLAVTTTRRIRQELHRPGRGVRRYLGDTFYGGSEWILLAASLGSVALLEGDRQLATDLLAWIQASATADGLPEQVADDVQSPHMLDWWRGRWGPTATPLLWSHAMHLVLLDDLGLLTAR